MATRCRHDPTTPHNLFQDDPYLSPRTSAEFKLYSLSQESGRAAAKYFVNANPKFFQKDFAQPQIPCLIPEDIEPRLEEVSEAALVERISLRKVKAAVEMYDLLLQSGTAVSMERTNELLDLICLHGDRDPGQKDNPETEDLETPDDPRRKKGRQRKAFDLLRVIWRENNNAERIFNLMPMRDEHSYSALIRGMVKHGAYAKAFNMYTDMLNNRLVGDVHIFNAMITAAPELREKYNEKWELITELLKQMSEQKVQPNLLTFNAILKGLRRCGSLARSQALHTLSEMKAMGIVPSLASFDHVLSIFYKAASSSQGQTDILQEVISEMVGKSFSCQDPDDVNFYCSAMRICLDTKDIEQAYRVLNLLGVGENWRLLGDSYQQSVYYGRFFNLLCIMEHIDVVLKWYKDLVPSVYYPNPQGMKDLLQALDTDSRLDLIPSIWNDIRSLGHGNKADLVEEVLSLMARDKHSPEVQEAFATCALDVKSVFDQEDRGRPSLEWTAPALTHITSLLLAGNKSQQAWGMLSLFKTKNRVPSGGLLEDFLSSCKISGSSQKAVELVQLSAGFCMPATTKLAKRVKEEFELTEEQKVIISDLEVAAEAVE
ncbi:small ribosomal subunit protein mS39 [Aplochiton taeniatus]